MNILKTIRDNSDLADKVALLCDIELYDENRPPYNQNGRITWNIDGIAFGQDGTGGEFVLLNDGFIGLNSSEGQTGRIAETIEELFSLLINCPCIYDFLDSKLYEDNNYLSEYSKKVEEEYRTDFNEDTDYDWDELKKEIANTLNLKIDMDISKNTLRIFQKVATTEPLYHSFYQENDGTKTMSDPLIF